MKKIYLCWLFLLALLGIVSLSAQEVGRASITVEAKHYNRNDTLVLRIFRKYHFGQIHQNPYEEIRSGAKAGFYGFQIDSIPHLTRVYLWRKGEEFNNNPAMALLDGYLLSPGDSIQIQAYPKQGWNNVGILMTNGEKPLKDAFGLMFRGIGAEKFIVKWTVDSLWGQKYKFSDIRYVKQYPPPYYVDDLFNARDAKSWNARKYKFRMNVLRDALQLYRPYLTDDVYYQLYADYVGGFYEALNYPFRFSLYHPERKEIWERTRDNFLDHYAGLEGADIPIKYLRSSPKYMAYVSYWLDNLYSVEHRENGIYANKYELIRDKAPVGLREALLTEEVLLMYGQRENPQILEDALRIIKDPYLLLQLEGLDDLAIGKPGATFELFDKDGKVVASDRFKGKVVFMDFYFLACNNCHSYIEQTVKPVYERYKNDERIVFVTVAAEDRKAYLRGLEWAALHGNNAYDLYTGALTFKHPLIQHYRIKAYPNPMIIGKDGNIFARSDRDLRSQQGLIAVIEEALAQD
ncbi:Cytochrome oxidase Cu insertion factor, SCO1/SenC/PrrC family [Sphingobacterium nematocida]|uniref:Cytochrome oxidase Cu insertion factor, SCO1/SenC/PrrC family n=1 Tax=Sphingobacterium nematocida TaxID=1513896 RepID=A0A1T5DW93_9SPHI|nr:thioredoxin-like domain-containing protein [Sphingobacterium nematocida]SKB75997.1 Cytochrome oxidase Cu insertion factor, SCO1/SenC/PrrC family [Sphingobacterium nematocida]